MDRRGHGPTQLLTACLALADADLLVLVCSESSTSAAPPSALDLLEVEVQMPALGPAGVVTGDQRTAQACSSSPTPDWCKLRARSHVLLTNLRGDDAQSAASHGRAHRKYGASPG